MTRRTVLFPAAVAVLLAAATFVLKGSYPWRRISDVPTALPILVTSPFRVTQDTLQQGETLGAVLRRQGVVGLDLATLAKALQIDPRKIKTGLIFAVRHDVGSDLPTHVEFRPNADQRVRFIRAASGAWRAESRPIHWVTDTVRVAGEIKSNVYDALDRGVDNSTLDQNERTRLAQQLADVNDYTIDFSRDLQPHDRFVAIVERQVSEEGDVRFKGVLADRFYLANRTYEAFAYPTDSSTAYYDGSGAALKRAFLMSPVEFKYISSGFSAARLHPILGIFRRHEGIDFVAASGSPVRAAGDGVVSIAGPTGGYGNLIEITHRHGVVTRYGHLSRIDFGVRPGVRVRQGEIIGQVGMTGLATAPHLHYEFRIDGAARDPRSMKFETGAPIAPSLRPDFERRRSELTTLLDGAPINPPITE